MIKNRTHGKKYWVYDSLNACREDCVYDLIYDEANVSNNDSCYHYFRTKKEAVNYRDKHYDDIN